jgi:hypothetical protein
MSGAIFAGFGPVPGPSLALFLRDVEALGEVDGFVFQDPADGLRPLHLAEKLRAARADAPVVIPLVARDANRTLLLGEARTADALGARGLLLLTGHLDPLSPARAVYDLDPLQLLGFLRDEGVRAELWVSGRCETEAERARAGALAEAGARRCVVPWEDGDAPPQGVGLRALLALAEDDRDDARVPVGWDVLVPVSLGRGAQVRARVERLRGRGR